MRELFRCTTTESDYVSLVRTKRPDLLFYIRTNVESIDLNKLYYTLWIAMSRVTIVTPARNTDVEEMEMAVDDIETMTEEDIERMEKREAFLFVRITEDTREPHEFFLSSSNSPTNKPGRRLATGHAETNAIGLERFFLTPNPHKRAHDPDDPNRQRDEIFINYATRNQRNTPMIISIENCFSGKVWQINDIKDVTDFKEYKRVSILNPREKISDFIENLLDPACLSVKG